MKKWTRWQDWAALIAGVYAFLAPIWTGTTSTATWTMVVLGVVTAAVSLWSLAVPADRSSEMAHAVLGVLFFVAPWVMGFSDLNAMSWAAWVVGVVTFVMGAWALPLTSRMHTAAPTH